MSRQDAAQGAQEDAERAVDHFRQQLGPFVVAAETTRMAMIFTNATVPNDPIVFANDSFLALTGYDRNEVLGKPLRFILGAKTDMIGIARVEAALAENVSGSLEITCRGKDGREFLAGFYLSPVADPSGTVLQHFMSFVDLSSHSERLMVERSGLHALYQDAPGFIAITHGPEHRFMFANMSYQKFIGRDVLAGQTVAAVLPEAADQGFVALLDDVFATGRPFVGDGLPITLSRGEGSPPETRYIDFIYQPVRDPENIIIGLFCEGHDVTEQRAARERVLSLQSELIHLSRVSEIGSMATTLAHELNQPIMAISNYAEACGRLVHPDAPHADALARGFAGIDESARRASGIIRQLREMTQRAASLRSAFDLNEAIAECVNLVRVAGCGEAVLNAVTNGPLPIEADRVQIQQVIINLLRNACEAAVAAGRHKVSIATMIDDGMVVVSIEDEGAGVRPDAVQTIFTWSASTKADGMGIGLSISRTIVEAHDGKLWIERTSPAGSCFRFSLPRPSN